MREYREFIAFWQERGHEECCGPSSCKVYGHSLEEARQYMYDYTDGTNLMEDTFEEGLLVDEETLEYIYQ